MAIIAIVTSLTQTSTARYLVDAFRRAGHITFVISDYADHVVQVCGRGAVDIAEVLDRHEVRPDLMLFVEGGSMQVFPLGLESLGCLTAWYGIDTHMDYEKHLRIARLFDVTFVAQQEYVAKLRADGIRQAFWLPLAFEPSLHPDPSPERIYDIAYVGSNNAAMHPVRHQLLALLATHFPNMWQGMATPQDMGRIYAQSRIVFNKSVNNDLNMRYFEAMGAGAVLVTDPIVGNGVDELFVRGSHFLEYRDEVSLLAQIHCLLSQPEELTAIGRAAREFVIGQHTYARRVRQLLDVTSQCQKGGIPQPADYFSTFIALRLSGPALRMVSMSFCWPRAGTRQRLIAAGIRTLLNGIAIVISAIDTKVKYLSEMGLRFRRTRI